MSSVQTRRKADGTTSYRVMFRVNGKQRSETFDDPGTARKFGDLVDKVGGAAAIALRDSRTGTAQSNIPTLAEWLEHHLDHATGITAGTIADYRRVAARSWLPTLGLYPVDAISRDMVRAWIVTQTKTPTRRGTPTAPKSIANAHGLLSTVMSAAVEAGHRPDNPCRGLTLPRGEATEMCFLSPNDFAQLLAHIDPWNVPLVSMLAATGLRWGEATALHWGDLDLDADTPTLRVARAWKRGAVGQRELGAPKTARSRRTVSLPPQVVEQLRERRGSHRPDQLVFTTPSGTVVDDRKWRPRHWIPAIEKSGIGKRPRIHDLRHSHASWLIAAGVPLPVVQRRLGHESIQTTVDTYGHLADGAAELAAAVTDRALTGALPQLEA